METLSSAACTLYAAWRGEFIRDVNAALSAAARLLRGSRRASPGGVEARLRAAYSVGKAAASLCRLPLRHEPLGRATREAAQQLMASKNAADL